MGAGRKPSLAQIFFSSAGLLHVVHDLLRQIGARVEHRHHDTAEIQRIVDVRGFQPLDIAPVLCVPDGQLPAERDGLGMDAVRAAHHRRVLELEGARLEHLAQALEAPQQQLRGFADLQGLRRIDHVVRGQAVMQVAPLAADVLRHAGGESDHVVLHPFLDFENTFHAEAPLAANGPRGALGNQARFRLHFRGCHLHIEPAAEFVFVAPDAAHLRACVTGDHRIPNVGFSVADFQSLISTGTRPSSGQRGERP